MENFYLKPLNFTFPRAENALVKRHTLKSVLNYYPRDP